MNWQWGVKQLLFKAVTGIINWVNVPFNAHKVVSIWPIQTGGFRNRVQCQFLVAWHSGRTSVFGRRTFPVLCSTCS